MKIKNLFVLALYFAFVSQAMLQGEPFPLNFSIPECKIVHEIPEKELDFAPLVPGDFRTYIYTDEYAYYKDYQRSYFAVTQRRGGWDCMRHYEILANGCIPYFVDLDKCDPNTMHFLPRELILEAMNLDGVSHLHIDHEKFDSKKYFEILEKLLAYTRENLTTKAMASHILKTIDYKGEGKILFLSQQQGADYMRCLTLIGLKELYQDKVVDVPKINHIYDTYGDVKNLYGRGMSYTKTLPDIPVDRTHIEERIMNNEFDLIIYGSVHRGLPFHELVQKHYLPEQVVYLCGEDKHVCPYTHLPNFFLREFEAIPHISPH